MDERSQLNSLASNILTMRNNCTYCRIYPRSVNKVAPQHRTQCFGRCMYFLCSLRNIHVSQVLSYFQLRFFLYAALPVIFQNTCQLHLYQALVTWPGLVQQNNVGTLLILMSSLFFFLACQFLSQDQYQFLYRTLLKPISVNVNGLGLLARDVNETILTMSDRSESMELLVWNKLFRTRSSAEHVPWIQKTCVVPEPIKETLLFEKRQGTIMDTTFQCLFRQTLG